jgi:hypothetical protein
MSEEGGGEGKSERSRRGRRLEGVIPDLLKRAVELGVEKAQEAPSNLKGFVGEMKLPKEIAQLILAQMEESKDGLFRVVAKEVRDFLEHANLSGEMRKMLTTLQFEINTTIRFKPNDQLGPDGKPAETSEDEPAPIAKPEVKTDVYVKRDEPRPRERRRQRE